MAVPLPATVWAATTELYVVKGLKEYSVRLRDSVNTTVASSVSSSVMLTTEPVITPFWSSSGGGPQFRWIEREERAIAVKLLGGELGTVNVHKGNNYSIKDS